jgi:hypothetical protein
MAKEDGDKKEDYDAAASCGCVEEPDEYSKLEAEVESHTRLMSNCDRVIRMIKIGQGMLDYRVEKEGLDKEHYDMYEKTKSGCKDQVELIENVKEMIAKNREILKRCINDKYNNGTGKGNGYIN